MRSWRTRMTKMTSHIGNTDAGGHVFSDVILPFPPSVETPPGFCNMSEHHVENCDVPHWTRLPLCGAISSCLLCGCFIEHHAKCNSGSGRYLKTALAYEANLPYIAAPSSSLPEGFWIRGMPLERGSPNRGLHRVPRCLHW